MVMQFVQRNQRFLKIYCVLSLFFGWICLAYSVIAAGISAAAMAARPDHWLEALDSNFDMMFKRIVIPMMCGLLAIGITKFIRYLSDPDASPGLLLRIGDKILYAYALYVVVSTALSIRHYPFSLTWSTAIAMLAGLFAVSGEVLIVVGLAQLLKRSLPMIEEYKSLV